MNNLFQEQKNLIEALLFAKSDPLEMKEIQRVTGLSSSEIQTGLSALLEAYRERGIQLVEVAEGYQFRTRPEFAEVIKELLNPPSLVRLSRAALETLAIVAYRQPVSRPDIQRMRGVDSDAVIQTLLDRMLIEEVARGEGVGRPSLYATTAQFLQVFGLKSLANLPSLESSFLWDKNVSKNI